MVIAGIVLLVLAGVAQAQAQLFKTVYSFTGGADGQAPQAGVVADGSGNLYGTTVFGGSSNPGYGVVFKVDASGIETVLYNFTGRADGAFPQSGVVRDPAGNLYGTTADGGDLNCNAPYGCGVVFKLDPAGNFAVLHTFEGSGDGIYPNGLLLDSAGNLYGTTFSGGSTANTQCLPVGCGVVFKVDTGGNESVLYTFTGLADGAMPYGPLIRDPAGNLYGTTGFGGQETGNWCSFSGCGVVFKLDPLGRETVLLSFNATDGKTPEGGLVRDSAGNLYGTTITGGYRTSRACQLGGCGVVFKLNPAGQIHVLYKFTGGPDGGSSTAGLVRDSAGNLYGTASVGGTGGVGVVFKVDVNGSETVLHSFTGGAGGSTPQAPLLNYGGRLWGTSKYQGATGYGGTVFAIRTM